MEVVHAREPLGALARPVLFLAGPTPRSGDVASWRPGALEVLARAGFEGSVLVPEDRDGTFRGEYDDQVTWEWEGLDRADAIAFWVPRRIPQMTGLTTNVEFGLWCRSGKAVLGTPEGAEKVTYLHWVAQQVGMEQCSTLEDTLAAAVALGRARTGA